MKTFKFKNTKSRWILPNVFLLKCGKKFIYNIWVISIVTGEKGKRKLKMCFKKMKFFQI